MNVPTLESNDISLRVYEVLDLIQMNTKYNYIFVLSFIPCYR